MKKIKTRIVVLFLNIVVFISYISHVIVHGLTSSQSQILSAIYVAITIACFIYLKLEDIEKKLWQYFMINEYNTDRRGSRE